MLLFVTGSHTSSEARLRSSFREVMVALPAVAASRAHPLTGAALVPAVTRMDLFLETFSPPAAGGPGWPGFDVPPSDQWSGWARSLRGGLRALIASTFPVGARYAARFEPAGPRLSDPSRESTASARTLAAEARQAVDPARRPADPRLWVVLAPPLPAELEAVFLATFVRAEPYGAVARLGAEVVDVGAWLGREVDRLIAGNELITDAFVVDLEVGGAFASARTEGGAPTARSEMFDLLSGLEDLFASRETLEPGEVYNRLHSHSGSEELYIVLEGEGAIRVNERVLPLRAGQCFGKPRGYGCATQIVNSGDGRMVFLDVGSVNPSEIDLCHYPEHGEIFARFAGHMWAMPTEAILPPSAVLSVYDRQYVRAAVAPAGEGPQKHLRASAK